ncbi:MAG: hypothetical protein ACFB5Z_14045 [Elainellaceae cyanobacterium]
MATAIIIFNGLISTVGLALAWRLVAWRRSLAALAHSFESTEAELAQALPQARRDLLSGAEASALAAQRLRLLKQRWRQLQQLLTLIEVYQVIARRRRSI